MHLNVLVRHAMSCGALPVVLGMYACITSASAQTYTLQPFRIAGATGVTVNAVNDIGTVAGVYTSSIQPYGIGFVGNSTKLALLQIGGTNSPVVTPTGINDTGAVIGTYYAGNAFGFTWRGGKFTSFFPAGISVNPPVTMFPPYIGNSNYISFNAYIGDGVLNPYAGPQTTPLSVSIGYFPIVASVNSSGQIAGSWQPFVGENITNAVFFGTRTKAITVLPPNAVASFGGFLNDKGAVAGDYQDAAGFLHGFIYTAGKYTTFDVPGEATTMSVGGLDSLGRIVGTYSDTKRQHGFLYYVGKVSSFGDWTTSENVHVAISPAGRYIFVSYAAQASGVGFSDRVICSGPGC